MNLEKLIFVHGEEADVVRAADAIIAQAERTAEQEANGSNVNGMVFFSSNKDAAIVREYDELRFQYQEKLNLHSPPILVADAPVGQTALVQSSPVPPVSFHRFDRGKRNDGTLTVMELEKILIQRVPLKRHGQAIYRYQNGYYRRLSDSDVMTLIHQTLIVELGLKGAANQLTGVLAFLQSDPAIEDTPLDAEKTPLLCVKNGLLDINTLQLYPHDARYFFTSCINADWLGAQPCPLFEAFLHQIAGGNELLILRLKQATGYIIAPDNRAKRFPLLQGKGDTGKSVYGNLMETFFDKSAVSHLDIFRFREKFSLSTLVDRRLNISMDMPRGELSDQAASSIKELTGRDPVTVEEKYKTPRSAVINCSLVFGTNHVLRLKSPDEAFAKRVLLLPFMYPVPKERQDHYLLEKLVTEKSGILFVALMAYRDLPATNYTFAGDDLYTFENQVAEQHKSVAESMVEFVQCCCIEADAFTPTETLFNAYIAFGQTRDAAVIHDSAAFSRQFSMICGNSVIRKKQRFNGVPVNGYLGVALKEGL